MSVPALFKILTRFLRRNLNLSIAHYFNKYLLNEIRKLKNSPYFKKSIRKPYFKSYGYFNSCGFIGYKLERKSVYLNDRKVDEHQR